MPQVLVLNSDVVICQHGHMFDLSLIFLGQCISKSLLVALQIIQTSFDGFNGLLMQIEMREYHTFIDIGRCNRFVSFLEIFIK